jgi:hypothetical protein
MKAIAAMEASHPVAQPLLVRTHRSRLAEASRSRV